MNRWFLTKEFGPPMNFPSCGTIACISGWACTLHMLNEEKLGTIREASARITRGGFYGFISGKNALGLNFDQADSLFYTASWPYDLNPDYLRLEPQAPEYAACVARAIDEFIACDGDWNRRATPTTEAK